MGVPKFYRWISERYPCLSEVVKENQVPEFDNLYLDMNGVIHTCSHPNDDDVHFRISEEQIFKDIFHYIETLYRIIRPKKVFFMAIDGVAPRAKMNQQRGRRFMSARNAQMLIDAAKKKGEELPTEARFDSNCITPGTDFMTRLHEHLQYFVHMKITTDENWRGRRIYLSGHNCPGEGEHKVMDFIRTERSSAGYDPDTRHCLYGLDADLIMLGLCSHEPHFSLLREEVKFLRPGAKNTSRTANAEQTTFHLLHLSLLREYLFWEFHQIKSKLSFALDMESIIDDWVLMGFLVGNDFIPHLPHVHIHDDALPILYATYMQVLPELDGYINESGNLNLARFEKFLQAFAKNDRRSFSEQYEDNSYLEAKSSTKRSTRRQKPQEFFNEEGRSDLVAFEDSDMEQSDEEEVVESDESSNSPRVKATGDQKPAFDTSSEDEEEEKSVPQTKSSALDCESTDPAGHDASGSPILTATEALKRGLFGRSAPVEAHGDESRRPCSLTGEGSVDGAMRDQHFLATMDDEDFENDIDATWHDGMNRAFKDHKRGYYREKMKYADITREQLREQAEGYIRAIQWNLHYYYHGCCSWNWYYPHHYTPYLSDIKDFANLKLEFEMSKPFLPFQQLLAVLPAASGQFLPGPFRELMTSPASPIIDFYPENFETDLNGKKNDWEAVVLIPFINEERLLEAMAEKERRLSPEERKRNSHGPHILFTTSDVPLGTVQSTLPGVFSNIPNNLAIRTEVDGNTFRIPKEKIVNGLLPGVHLDVFFPGFPTMKNLPHTAMLKNAGVKVFQAPSRRRNMILIIGDRPEYKMEHAELARHLIGKEVHIEWPMLQLAKVDSIATKRTRYEKSADGSIQQTEMSTTDSRTWDTDKNGVEMTQFGRRGIELNDIGLLVYVNRLLGIKYSVKKKHVAVEKQWADNREAAPLQMIVENVAVHASPEAEGPSTVDDAFPVGCTVFILSSEHPKYGYSAKIKTNEINKDGYITVTCEMPPEPELYGAITMHERSYHNWMNGFSMAKKLRLDNFLLSRLTGTVYLVEGTRNNDNSKSNEYRPDETKVNIGLNLKFSKRNEEVPDYTRRDSNGAWLYSMKTLKIIQEYHNKFSEIFDFLRNSSSGNDLYYTDDLWPADGGFDAKKRLKELRDWLKALPCASVQRQAGNTDTLGEGVVLRIEEEVKKNNLVKEELDKIPVQKLGVRPSVLYRPCLFKGNSVPDPKAEYKLFDRVVNVREGFAVPTGLRGTVVGVHPGKSPQDLRIDALFDEEFLGASQFRGNMKSGYRMPASALINLTYGERVRNEKTAPPARAAEAGKEAYGWQKIVSGQDSTVAGRPPQQQQQQFNRQWSNPSNYAPAAPMMQPPIGMPPTA
uniref:5'-3' exoribonuclease 1 n=1 Tax=Plectus sambesii TaxID=2011161 RepID=A0A914V899_9BILA